MAKRLRDCINTKVKVVAERVTVVGMLEAQGNILQVEGKEAVIVFTKDDILEPSTKHSVIPVIPIKKGRLL